MGALSQAERWEAFAHALTIALSRTTWTQKYVAEKLGIPASTLSEWKTGKGEPDRAEVTFALEKLLGCDPGFLSVHLGYLPLEVAGRSWETALLRDPDVADETREILLALARRLKKALPPTG